MLRLFIGNPVSYIQTAFVINTTCRIPHGDHPDAGFGQKACVYGPHITKSLNPRRSILPLNSQMIHGLNSYMYASPACRLLSPERTSYTNRFSCYNTRDWISPLVAVCIHHPRHDLLICPDIRGRYVMVRTDQGKYLGSIASRKALKFFSRHIFLIAPYTALGATVGQSD